jgi:hypothetical protein
MKMEERKNVQKETTDVMLLLAEEAERMISSAGKSALKEADEETEKFLRQYEQKARQIILKTREDSRSQANEMAERFRDALILRIEEASTAALSQTIIDAGVKTGEIVKRLQETTKREARQALAEGLIAGDPASRSRREEVKLDSKPETPATMAEDIKPISDKNEMELKPPSEDFENWLRQ